MMVKLIKWINLIFDNTLSESVIHLISSVNFIELSVGSIEWIFEILGEINSAKTILILIFYYGKIIKENSSSNGALETRFFF